MSDVSQGPGWWQASDGKWYPPQATPGPATAPPPQPVPGQAPAPKKRGRGCLYSVVGLIALIVIIVVIAAVAGGGGGNSNKTASPNSAPDNNSASNTTTAAASSGALYKIGETAQTSGLDVTVY